MKKTLFLDLKIIHHLKTNSFIIQMQNTKLQSNQDAAVTEYSFDAWGRRRSPSDWNNYDTSGEPPLFADRGFTGHEHMTDFDDGGFLGRDEKFDINLINGRLGVYPAFSGNPVVGRFLNPDNFVQQPGNTQSYNRYSYCLNNPLKYTDTSGESIDWLIWGAIQVGNYAVNLTQNWIKTGSLKEGFKNTPIMAGINFSPSNKSFSDYQVDAYNTAQGAQIHSFNFDNFIASQSGIGKSSDYSYKTPPLKEYEGISGLGISLEIAFPKKYSSNYTELTGVGLDFGLFRDKNGLGLYATTKYSLESAIAFGIAVEHFGAHRTRSNPNSNIDRSDIRGKGYEVGLGLGPVGGSFSKNNAADYGKFSNYYMYSISLGYSIDVGYANWNTKTFLTGH